MSEAVVCCTRAVPNDGERQVNKAQLVTWNGKEREPAVLDLKFAPDQHSARGLDGDEERRGQGREEGNVSERGTESEGGRE